MASRTIAVSNRTKNTLYNETHFNQKGNTVPDTTNTVNTASTKAAKAAVETVPVIVETVEVGLEVPAKVVLNQKLVVLASVLVGAGLTAGGYWGVNKWRSRNAAKKAAEVEFPDENK